MKECKLWKSNACLQVAEQTSHLLTRCFLATRMSAFDDYIARGTQTFGNGGVCARAFCHLV